MHGQAALLFAAGFLIPALRSGAAQSNPAALRPGDLFPRFSGQTLAGKSLELPVAAANNPSVVIFSFSRTGGKDAALWNQRLATEFSGVVPIYLVMMLESVPKLFRGAAISGIRSSMPVPFQNRAIVLYEGEKLWKFRLSVSDGNRAYVVLLGPDGHVGWNNSGSFADFEYSRLKDEIGRLLQPSSRR